MFRLVVAVLYALLVAAVLVDYYVAVRNAAPYELIDSTVAILLLGLISVVPGALIGRWWAIALPLSAFVVAAVLAVVSSSDDRYGAVAADAGGEVGVGWLGLAALICLYAVPAAAVGVALGRWAQLVKRAREGAVPDWLPWSGLIAAALVVFAAMSTFGLGFVLAPISLAFSVVVALRVPSRRKAAWAGVAANLLLLVPLAAILIYGY